MNWKMGGHAKDHFCDWPLTLPRDCCQVSSGKKVQKRVEKKLLVSDKRYYCS